MTQNAAVAGVQGQAGLQETLVLPTTQSHGDKLFQPPVSQLLSAKCMKCCLYPRICGEKNEDTGFGVCLQFPRV